MQNGTATEKYLPGTTIEEIYALYEFDRKLRILTLEYILEIEKHIKAVVAYCFSQNYGHKNYLNPVNFDTLGEEKCKNVCSLILKLHKNISDNNKKEPSVTHYVNEKNYVPLWVLVNTISMGDISKFYANMIQKDRAEVSKRIKYGVKEKELESYLFFLSTIRNRCAHDERLFSYLSYVEIPINTYLRYFHSFGSTKNYFALMTVFKTLLPKDRYCEYQNCLETLQKQLELQLSVITLKDVQSMMGIPKKWKRLKNLR